MATQNEEVNLFLSATKDQFIRCLEVVWSVRLNTDKLINAWILVDQPPDLDVDFKKHRINVNLVDAKNLNLESTHKRILDDKYPTLGYGRLFITKIVPSEVKKLLYLDTDIFAYHNIDELYSIDVSGKYAAVVMDISAQCFAKDELARTKVTKYFNAGMMLLNLDKIREDKVDDACIAFYRNPPDWYIQNNLCINDQTILNYCFKENVFFIDPKFSIQVLAFGYPQYDKFINTFQWKDLKHIVQNGVFVHAQGKAKPWDFEQFLHWQSYQLQKRIWMFDVWNNIRKNLLSQFPQLKNFYTT